jgi:hypothetical protein
MEDLAVQLAESFMQDRSQKGMAYTGHIYIDVELVKSSDERERETQAGIILKSTQISKREGNFSTVEVHACMLMHCRWMIMSQDHEHELGGVEF